MNTPCFSASFPSTRMRRMRSTSWSRDLMRENQLSASDLIYPIFIQGTSDSVVPIDAMPGVVRYPLNQVANIAKQTADLGIPAIALFPQTPTDKRSEDGKEALNPNNLVCQAVKIIRETVPNLGVICDVALDPYTSHGHDGIMIGNEIANDETVQILCAQAINQAKAGCTVIAPSDMMDGRIGKIRNALDQEGFKDVIIMSYAAKYASCLYGPFRDAVGAASGLGKKDKKSYQMDPANSDEALREVALDISEGADIVMVKPAGFYLDIIQKIKETFKMPTAAYQVSGEYSMICAAANNGWLDKDKTILESLLSIKRAGADSILTYFAIDAAKLLVD
jgi:porphobilinogen synthase